MSTSTRKDIFNLAVLSLLGFLLFGIGLGRYALFDPDEPFYALTAKEMLLRGDWSTPVLFGQPQFEKPVFFYWVILAAYKIFGVNEWAARIGPCLAGILTVLATYLWGRVLFRRREIAFLSAAILATSFEFIILSRIVLTDMVLCLFVTAALCAFSAGYRFTRHRGVFWTLIFAFCALGFLTKGPLGLLLPFFGIIAFLFLNGEARLLKQMPWARGLLVFSLIALPWVALMAGRHVEDFLRHFFVHENVRRFFVAEHRGMDRLYLYPAVLLLGFAPWSVFLPGALIRACRSALRKRTRDQKALLFLVSVFAVIFIFFSLAKSKLPSYIFPLFPAAALLTAAWVYRVHRASGFGNRLSLGAFLAVMVLLSGIVFGAVLPKADRFFASRHFVGIYRELVPAGSDRFLLASKLYVRGTAFYTENANVGVWLPNPHKSFYTKPSIPILSTQDDLLKVGKGEFPVYCFLGQKETRHLRSVMGGRFSLTVIAENPKRVLARLDRNDS